MLNYFNRKLRNKKGFTLVELIVVIAVLGILATIAVPQYAGVRTKANQGVDDQTAALLQNGVALYNAEHQLPPTNNNAQMVEAVTNVFAGAAIPAAKVSGNLYYYSPSLLRVVAATSVANANLKIKPTADVTDWDPVDVTP